VGADEAEPSRDQHPRPVKTAGDVGGEHGA